MALLTASPPGRGRGPEAESFRPSTLPSRRPPRRPGSARRTRGRRRRPGSASEGRRGRGRRARGRPRRSRRPRGSGRPAPASRPSRGRPRRPGRRSGGPSRGASGNGSTRTRGAGRARWPLPPRPCIPARSKRASFCSASRRDGLEPVDLGAERGDLLPRPPRALEVGVDRPDADHGQDDGGERGGGRRRRWPAGSRRTAGGRGSVCGGHGVSPLPEGARTRRAAPCPRLARGSPSPRRAGRSDTGSLPAVLRRELAEPERRPGDDSGTTTTSPVTSRAEPAAVGAPPTNEAARRISCRACSGSEAVSRVLRNRTAPFSRKTVETFGPSVKTTKPVPARAWAAIAERASAAGSRAPIRIPCAANAASQRGDRLLGRGEDEEPGAAVRETPPRRTR